MTEEGVDIAQSSSRTLPAAGATAIGIQFNSE